MFQILKEIWTPLGEGCTLNYVPWVPELLEAVAKVRGGELRRSGARSYLLSSLSPAQGIGTVGFPLLRSVSAKDNIPKLGRGGPHTTPKLGLGSRAF